MPKRYRQRIFRLAMVACSLCIFALKGFGQDTTVAIQSSTQRLGINTFSWRSSAISSLKHTRTTAHIDFLKDLVYNTSLSSNRFVAQDFIMNQWYAYRLNRWLYVSQNSYYYDYGATGTRLAGGLAGLAVDTITPQYVLSGRLAAGYVSDQRIQFTDHGTAAESRIFYQSNLKDTSGYYGIVGFGSVANIQPRFNSYYRMQAQGFKEFNAAANAFGAVGIKNRRVEDYLGTNIQSIVSDTLFANFNVNYVISPTLTFRSLNSAQSPGRDFNYRPSVSEQSRQNIFYDQDEYNLRQELVYQKNRLMASARYEYRLRERRYGITNNLGLDPAQQARILEQERAKDIREETQAYVTNLRFIPNRRYELGFSTISQLLRVDTYSSLNQQNRDELFYNVEAYVSRFWFSNLRTDLKLGGNFRHLVYLSSGQALENLKERILRLEPGFRWQQGPLSWSGFYSLFVTYNVRDFNTEQDKNRSNRIFLTTQNLDYRIGKTDRVQLDFLRRENRLGRLNWETFAESPIDTVVIYDCTLKWVHAFTMKSTHNDLRAGVGYRYLRQNRNNLSGISEPGLGSREIALSNITLQHGPVISFFQSKGQNLQISADFWLQIAQVYNKYTVTENPFAGPNQTAEELNARQNNFFPYFTVNVIYGLYRQP